MDFVKQLRNNTTLAVTLRYGVAILGAVLTTAGVVSATDLEQIVKAANDIMNGTFLVVTAISTVAPVVYAMWKAWFRPALPVKDMAPSVKESAVTSVKASKEAKKSLGTLLDIFRNLGR
jgi:hypothetical protein